MQKCGCGYTMENRTALLVLSTRTKIRCGEQPLEPHTADRDSSTFVSTVVCLFVCLL